MTSVIRPYADVEGIFAGIDYRGNLVDSFERIDVDGGDATTIVRVDDLRTIPQHEIKVRLNLDVLRPHYEKHKDKLRLLIVARDATLRREIRLGFFPLDEIPSTISLDRALLRTTALRDVLPLDFSVVLDQHLGGDRVLPTQRASRLAELRFVIRNSAGGATFPFERVTAEEFKTAGLPSEAGLHLELYCGAAELIAASDTPISKLLKVWVHEKVWVAVQNDRGPITSKIRLTAMTLQTIHLILSVVLPLLKKGDAVIEEKSVVGQLLAHLEQQASLEDGRLLKEFQEEASLQALDPYLQHAWRFVSVFGRIEQDSEEQP